MLYALAAIGFIVCVAIAAIVIGAHLVTGSLDEQMRRLKRS